MTVCFESYVTKDILFFVNLSLDSSPNVFPADVDLPEVDLFDLFDSTSIV